MRDAILSHTTDIVGWLWEVAETLLLRVPTGKPGWAEVRRFSTGADYRRIGTGRRGSLPGRVAETHWRFRQTPWQRNGPGSGLLFFRNKEKAFDG